MSEERRYPDGSSLKSVKVSEKLGQSRASATNRVFGLMNQNTSSNASSPPMYPPVYAAHPRLNTLPHPDGKGAASLYSERPDPMMISDPWRKFRDDSYNPYGKGKPISVGPKQFHPGSNLLEPSEQQASWRMFAGAQSSGYGPVGPERPAKASFQIRLLSQ